MDRKSEGPGSTEPATHVSSQRSGWRNPAVWLGCSTLLIVLAIDLVTRVMLPGDAPPQIADDLRSYYYPAYLSAYGRLLQEGLQLWNPYQLTGIPRAGAIQIGLFYPFHALYGLLPLPIGMTVNAVLHLAIVTVSTIGLARRLGLAWPAALLAGALVANRGHFVAMLYFPNMLEAATWAVPGCIAITDLSRGRFLRPLGLLGLCTGMSLLAGYPQATVYSAYLWGALLCILLVTERASARGWVFALLCLGGAVALGAAVGSIQLLPAMELSELGNRKIEPLTMEQMFPMRPPQGDLWTIFVNKHHFTGSPTELPFYFGAVGLALLPAAFFSRRRRLQNGLLALLVVLLIVFTMGPASPLFDLYLALPLLDSFRLPVRLRFTIDVCFAILAASGLDTLLRQFERGTRAAKEGESRLTSKVPGAAIAVFFAAVVLSGVLLSDEGRRGSVVFAIAVGALALLGARFARSRRAATWVGIAALAVCVAEIALSPDNDQRIAYLRPELIEVFHRDDALMRHLRRSDSRTLVLGPGFTTPELPRKLPSAQRFLGLLDYEPATTKRQSDYFSYLSDGPKGLEPSRVPFAGSIALTNPQADPDALTKRRRLLELTAMKYVLSHRDMPSNRPALDRYLKARKFTPFLEDDEGNVLRKTRTPLPRAYVAYRVKPAPDTESLLDRMSRPTFDPLRLSFAEGAPEIPVSAQTPARGAPAKILENGSDRVVVRADLLAPGMLVLADAYYPGWRATSGKEELQIHPVNHLFRGVVLPKGQHEVVFEYAPRSYRIGVAASAVGLGACVSLIALPRRSS